MKNQLTPLKNATAKKTNKAVLDIETINWVEPYAIGFYNEKEFIYFEGSNCIFNFLQEFLKRKYAGVKCYAHNGGKFDFSFLLNVLMKSDKFKEYTIKPLKTGSRILCIQIIKNKQKWELRDSMGLFMGFSLRKLTNNFNVETKKGDFDHNKINWKNWRTLKSEWLPYLKDDCKSLFQVLDIFEKFLIDKFNVDLNNTITLAQISLKSFKKNYLLEPINTYETQEEDIRKSYYGGRTEIFTQFETNMYYYDVNSLYPYVMSEKEFPINTPIKSSNFELFKDYGICKANVYVPDTINYPPLPYREEETNKLIFPTGNLKGWWCSPELEEAYNQGCKVEIETSYKFDKKPLFKDYIIDLYEIKQNSNKNSVQYMTSKLLMNSLYGKFGQKREKENIVFNPENTIGLEPIDMFEELGIYKEKTYSSAKHILPAIASFITCYARLELYKYIKQCEPIYCDTDSIITKDLLPTSNELGGLSLEVEGIIKEGVFLLPKLYSLKMENGEYVKSKGFRSGQFSHQNFKYALLNNDFTNIYENQYKVVTPMQSIKKNKKFTSMGNFYKSIKSTYSKREILEDFKTKPKII